MIICNGLINGHRLSAEAIVATVQPYAIYPLEQTFFGRTTAVPTRHFA